MTISEVSKKYEISTDTLRYYERIGLIPKVRKNKSGNRDFTEVDCNWVEFIKCMRGAGISVESLIDYVKLFQEGDNTIKARKQILVEEYEILTEKIKKLQEVQERLRLKIELYDKNILEYEEKLKKYEKTVLSKKQGLL